MKKLALALVAASALLAQQGRRPAPDFVIHVPGQPDIHLSKYKGRVVLLALLNTGCTHCQHFAQDMLGPITKEYGPKGVQVLAAVFDNDAKTGLAKFRDQFVRGFPVGYSDETTVLAWLKQPVEEGYFVPIVAFIGKSGYIEGQHLGDDIFFQDASANIHKTLDGLLKGR